MFKFKHYGQCCANPFLTHKKAIIVGLRAFTSDLKCKFDTEMDLENEEFICTNCYNKICKLPPKVEEDNAPKSSSRSSSPNSEYMSIQVEHDEYLCMDEANKTLQLLNVSPFKTHKFYMKVHY